MAEQIPTSMDWRSETFRRKVINQIDEAVRLSATPMTKSSAEMENHVFMKAKTREEYLALVARLILHVKGINAQKEKDKKAQPAGGMGYPPQQGMPPGGAGGMQQQPMQDPINALQNLAMQGTTQMPGQQPGMMTPQQQQQLHLHQQQQRQQMLQHPLLQQQQQQQQQQQRMALAAQQQRPQLQRQDAFIVTSAQNVQVQPVAQQLPASAAPQQVSYQHQGPPSGPVQQRQMVPQVSMANMNQQGVYQQTLAQQQQQLQQQQQQQQQSPMMSQPQSSAVPSPVQQMSSQMTTSPMSMMTSPSPQGIVPSPASRAQTYYGAPSPSSTNLNTPAGTGAVPRSQEEQAYLDKLNKLSKYIDPLRRMINRLSADRDEDRVKDIHKMKNLLEILTDPSKRLAMNTLLKCEQVLEKLDLPSKSSTPSTSSITPVTTSSHMCQPLLDAVAAHMKSPMLNHSLQRTFGPAISALHGSPIRAPSPPPKRRKTQEEEEEEEDENGIPHVLQGEIARLGSRFKVNFDPTQHGSSKDIHLLCRLDDKNLPSVPPISVKVPATYPQTSPECDTGATEYESNNFLQSVQQSLTILLLRMPDKFTFTELLDKWELSVRKACAVSV